MIYLRVSRQPLLILLSIWFISCGNPLPEIKAKVITQKTPHDTDDPAIWFNKANPKSSIVFGTDKDETNGGVYAFDLNGDIIKEKSITGLSYPNNVDIAYDFKLNDSTKTDIIMFTEREKNQIRLFSVPDMIELDGGGFPVFEDAHTFENRRPMGIAIYTDINGKHYAIVSRKEGPFEDYLYQYEIVSDNGEIQATLVRKFGNFSGKKEIEAIAVDNELGYVYYSDEMHCIHKYYADPSEGNEEISCFGSEYFSRDIEGIAIAKFSESSGYLIVSDQQSHGFSVFDRKTNQFVMRLNLGTIETDGCEVSTKNLGPQFPNGLFVSMTDSKEFYFHDLSALNLIPSN